MQRICNGNRATSRLHSDCDEFSVAAVQCFEGRECFVLNNACGNVKVATLLTIYGFISQNKR